jgi:hypothetical protein
MEKGFARFGRMITAVLAVGVAVYSFRLFAVLFHAWPGIDSGIRDTILRAPAQALTHMLAAPVALLVGPFQFFPQLRAACVVAGLGGLATAPYASGGPVAGLGFGVLAALWIAATLGGWRAAVGRKFELHRLLMRFSYAMTFGAVTLRLQIPIGFALGYTSYSAMSVWLAYTSWIPNVIVVAFYSMAEALRRPRLSATA